MVKICVKSIRPDIVGFNPPHNSLIFIMPDGSTTNDLLETINKHRMPKNRINKLANKMGVIFENELLRNNTIYFIGI